MKTRRRNARFAGRLSALLIGVLSVGIVQRGVGAPADIMTSAAPVLGGEEPAPREVKEGDATVSAQTGAFQYSFPIAVPPGRNGLEPKLSLNYSSQGALYGSPVGAGWTLSGIDWIEVDPASSLLATDYRDQGTGPAFIASLSGGRRLVPVNESAPAGVAQTYRVRDGDTRFIRYQRFTNGLWQALAPDGLTYEFGNPAHLSAGTSGPVAFSARHMPITAVRDGFGNSIDLHWDPEELDGEQVDVRLNRIEYTNNVAAGIGPAARVSFTYAPLATCPGAGIPVGAMLDYRAGTKRVKGASRISAITTQVKDTSYGTLRTVRNISLQHDWSAAQCDQGHGPIRMLESITETAYTSPEVIAGSAAAPPSAVTLPPVTFTYGPLERSFNVEDDFSLGYLSGGATGTLGHGERLNNGSPPTVDSMLQDMDGDGRPDWVIAGGGPGSQCYLEWFKNDGTGISTVASARIYLPTLPWSIVPDARESCSLAGQLTYYRNITTSGNNCENTPDFGTFLGYRLLDLNADQRPEIILGLQFDEWRLDPHAPEIESVLGAAQSCPPPACPVTNLACMVEAFNPTCNQQGCVYDPQILNSCFGAAPLVGCGRMFLQPSPEPCNGQTCPPDWEMPLPPTGKSCGFRKQFEVCDNYPWYIRWNAGDGTYPGATELHLVPAPLDSEAGDSSVGAGRFSSSSHTVQDMDGDGFTDIAMIVRVDDWDPSMGEPHWWYVFRGDGTGSFHPASDGFPYAWPVPPGAQPSWAQGYTPTPPPGEDPSVTYPSTAGMLADINGDGLPDLVTRPRLVSTLQDPYSQPGETLVYFNLGKGFMPLDTTGPATFANYLHTALKFPNASQVDIDDINGKWVSNGRRRSQTRSIDLDGDGRPDFVSFDPNCIPGTRCDVEVMHGSGAGVVAPVALVDAVTERALGRLVEACSTEPSGTVDGSWAVREDLLDIDGDGQPEVIQYSAGEPNPQNPCSALAPTVEVLGSVPSGKPLRLLNRIDNGRGGHIDVRYAVHTDASVVIEPAAPQTMPSPQWVASSLTRGDAFGSADVETTYKYGSPVWSQDPINNSYGFRGFDRARYLSPGGALTEETYDYVVDWSGRLAKTVVFHDASATSAHTISETAWVEKSLYSTTVKSYYPWVEKSYTCAAGRSEAQCRADGLLVRTDHSYAVLSSGGSPATEMYVEASVKTSEVDSSVVSEGDRTVVTTHEIFAGPSLYRTRATQEERRISQGGEQVVGRTEHIYEASGLWERETKVWHDGTGATIAVSDRVVDNVGNVTSERSPNQVVLSATWAKTSYGYDSNRLYKTQTTRQAASGAVVLVTSQLTDAGTGLVRISRGPNFEVVTWQLPWGGTYTSNSYEEERTDFDSFGRPYVEYQSIAQGSGQAYLVKPTKKYAYIDYPFGQQDPRTSVTETSYVEFDSESTAALTTRYYDGLSRLAEQRDLVSSGTPETWAVTRYHYDAASRLERFEVPTPIYDIGWEAYDYRYDSVGRVTHVLRPPIGVEGATTGRQYEYDGLTTTRYDLVQDDGPAAISVLTRDVFGKLVSVTERVGVSMLPVFPEHPTEYTYDANDNLATVSDPDGALTVLVHDWAGHRLQITRQGTRTWTYGYDLNGNLISQLVPHTSQSQRYLTTYTYDALDRPVTTLVGEGGLDSTQALRAAVGPNYWTQNYYDTTGNSKGRLSYTALMSSGVITSYEAFVYDGRGNVKSDWFYVTLTAAQTGGVALGQYRELRHDFGAMNQIRESRFGDYDNDADSTRITRSYDRRGLPDVTTWVSGGGPRVIADDTRNRAGLVTARTHQPGAAVFNAAWSYDRLGRVTEETIKWGTQLRAKQELEYFHSDDVKRNDATHWTYLGGETTRHYEYEFDHQHQLVGAVGPGGFLQQMSYLPSGRIDRADVTAPAAPSPFSQGVTTRNVDYEYGGGGSGHEVTGLLDSGGGGQMATYTYDEAGNMLTSVTHFGGVTKSRSYAYDAAGRMRVATVNGQQEVYHYLGAGKRLASVRWGSSVRMYFGELELAISTANGAVTKRQVYVSHGTTTTRIENKNTVETILQSTLGHTLVALDAGTGFPMANFIYAPFGEQTLQNGTATHSRRINNKEEDAHTGLTYYGYRYYDPVAMIWTQGDPLYRYAPDVSLEEPRKQNLYTYSLNSPLRYVDPDGRKPEGTGSWDYNPAERTAMRQSVVGKFVDRVESRVASNLNPINVAKGIAAVVTDPVGSAAAIVDGGIEMVKGIASGDPDAIADAVGDLITFAIAKKLEGGGGGKGGGGRSGNQFRGPDPAANGTPHTRIRMDENGVTNYETYGHPTPDTGKRVDVTGSAHGGVETPHVVETKRNVNPNDPSKSSYSESRPRPARPDELPKRQ